MERKMSQDPLLKHLDREILIEAANNFKSDPSIETGTELIDCAYSNQPMILPQLKLMFRAFIGQGRTPQEAFDAVARKYMDIMGSKSS
jgi:hypothetical protein